MYHTYSNSGTGGGATPWEVGGAMIEGEVEFVIEAAMTFMASLQSEDDHLFCKRSIKVETSLVAMFVEKESF